jgi:predicted phosphodiesterase
MSAAAEGSSARPMLTVGVISDTHGHLYPEVKKFLFGVDHIIHAGDIGSQQVLAELKTMAPVTAVRGNCDHDQWAVSLPVRAELTLAGAHLIVGHIGWQVQEWAEAAAKSGAVGEAAWGPGHAGGSSFGRFDAVIFGHSHQPAIERRLGVLYLNPGSAGPRRFNRPRSLARLTIRSAPPGEAAARPQVEAEILDVE